MADENLISLQPGTVIAGKYEVVKCLGAGSMGLVYACRHRELSGHLVAIKVLFPEVAQDNVAAARFRNEIVASYGVSHPHVVRAYEYFRDGDLVAYTMEYVGGGDLAERLGTGDPLPIPEVIRLLSQITSGVQAIHEAGIVHRDLKPENILLTPSGDVKITDFGIARTGHGPKLTEHGGVVGTIDYVSPEYLEKGHVDARSDIYALGVLAYEMITGESPFRGDSVIATMTMRLRSDAKPPSSLRNDCPPALDRIILKALARDPEQRYQASIEIFYDLQEMMGPDRMNQGGYLHAPRNAGQATGAARPSSLPRAPSIAEPPSSSMLAGQPSGFATPRRPAGNDAASFGREAPVRAAPSAAALQGMPATIGGQGFSRQVMQPQYSEEDTIQEPMRMESVLSHAMKTPQPNSSPVISGQVSLGESLDRGRIRTLSHTVGEMQRTSWIIDAVLVFVAVLIAFGVGLAALNVLWPDLWKQKKSERGYDITIFDNDIQ